MNQYKVLSDLLTIARKVTAFLYICSVEVSDAIQMLLQSGDPSQLTFQHVALSLQLVGAGCFHVASSGGHHCGS